MFYLVALGDSGEEVQVIHIAVTLSERARLPHVAAPEGGFEVGETCEVAHEEGGETCLGFYVDHIAISVNAYPLTGHGADCRMVLKALSHCTKGPFEIKVVTHERAEYLSSCLRESFYHGMVPSPVRFALPPGQAVLILANDLQRSIRAPSIYHDVFDAGIVLIADRLDRLLEIGSRIECRRHDRDLRHANS